MNGKAGHDSLRGLDGNDTIDGQSGDDALDGGRGDDDLAGGAGDDRLTGGRGSDTFIFRDLRDGTVETDTIADHREGQIDTIDLAGGAARIAGEERVAGVWELTLTGDGDVIRLLVVSDANRDGHVVDDLLVVWCLIPEFGGALFSAEWKDALWAKFSMGAPARRRRSVARSSIVKRA